MVRLFTPRLGRLDPLAGQGAGAAPRGGGAVRKGGCGRRGRRRVRAGGRP